MDPADTQRPVIGRAQALWVYTAPAALFRRVEDTGAYGWALAFLLVSVTLLGYLQVQTGLIDRVVDRRTESKLAELEKGQTNLLERRQLREVMDNVRKEGKFLKTITRIQAVALSPLVLLGSLLLTASALYAVVALTGRKAEYHTLMSICVYAAFVDLLGRIVRVAMMFYYGRLEVSTSLGMLSPAGQPSFLVALDPFLVWYWVLVGMGLTITRQLGRTLAIIIAATLGVLTMALRVAWAYQGQ